MRFPVLIFVLAALLAPAVAQAKRMGPAKVEPVIYEGIKYSAPNDDGRRAYIQVADAKTGKALYEIVVFTTKIDPALEEDVQWVFIKGMKLDGAKLVVTDERGRVYYVDLQTRKVTPLGQPGG